MSIWWRRKTVATRLVVNQAKEGGARCCAMRTEDRPESTLTAAQPAAPRPHLGGLVPSCRKLTQRQRRIQSNTGSAVLFPSRLRMVLLRVGVAGFVGGTVLDDLAVSADMDMRVSENRRHYTERQCKPGEIKFPAYHHEVTDPWAQTPTSASIMIDSANILLPFPSGPCRGRSSISTRGDTQNAVAAPT